MQRRMEELFESIFAYSPRNGPWGKFRVPRRCLAILQARTRCVETIINMAGNLDNCTNLCYLRLDKSKIIDVDTPPTSRIATALRRQSAERFIFDNKYLNLIHIYFPVRMLLQVEIMMDGLTINSLVVGGPAFRSGKLAQGDIVLVIDCWPVNLANILLALRGDDRSGSAV
jgi:hypothetical protein